MKQAELLIKLAPSGDPMLRGSCSSCPEVTFAFVGNTDANLRLMQAEFDQHCAKMHAPEKADALRRNRQNGPSRSKN